MEDFLMRPLSEGDSVIFLVPGQRTLVLGRVIRFSEKQVRIAYKHPYRHKERSEVSRYPGEIVRVDGPDLTAYLLKKD